MVFKLIQKIKLKLGRFRQNQNLTLNFRNTAWLFIEKIIRMVVGFFVGVWVARYLGPEQFGIFSYAQSFAGLFIVVAALGLDSVVVRELVKDESSGNEIMATAFWLKILGALVALLMLVTAVNFTSGDLQTNILVFIIASSVIFQSFNVVDFYFQAKVLSKYIAYVNIISLFLSSIVKIVLIVNNESLISFAWVVLFDSFILAVGFIYVYVKRNSKFRMQNSKFKIKIAIDLFKKGLPLIFAGAITVFIMRIDQVMIQEIKGSYDVGIYAASVKVTEIWYFIAIVISNSLFPFLINSKNKSNYLFFY